MTNDKMSEERKARALADWPISIHPRLGLGPTQESIFEWYCKHHETIRAALAPSIMAPKTPNNWNGECNNELSLHCEGFNEGDVCCRCGNADLKAPAAVTDTYHLDDVERKIMDNALRKSVKTVHKAVTETEPVAWQFYSNHSWITATSEYQARRFAKDYNYKIRPLYAAPFRNSGCADPHKEYGPCDALGPNGSCAECLKLYGQADKLLAALKAQMSVRRNDGMTQQEADKIADEAIQQHEAGRCDHIFHAVLNPRYHGDWNSPAQAECSKCGFRP